MSDTKQTVLADEEIRSKAQAIWGMRDFGALEFARAIESAVLSKLRAAGEPSAEEAAALYRASMTETKGGFTEAIHHFARALLSRYAAPQASAEVTASEAVFAFAAWLSCRDEVVEFGSTQLATTQAMLVDAFVKSQDWTEPRLDYHTRLRPYPKSAPAAEDSAKGAGNVGGIRSPHNACMHRDACRAMLDRQQRGGDVALPARWRFDISHIDGRAWLTITTPGKASATLSCASASEGGGETIGSQVLRYLSDDLALATLAAMSAQPAASAEPSDDDIQALAALADRIEHANGEPIPISVEGAAVIRALLSRYGRPAGDAQPVRWVHTLHSEHDDPIAEKVTGTPKSPFGKPRIDYDPAYRVTSEPLYDAPVAAHRPDGGDAKDAERYRWLRDAHPADQEGLWVAHGLPGRGLDCWRNEELDAAIDAAIAQQRKEGK